MTEFAANAQARSRGRLGQWLFNPFRFVAGARALLLGLAVILISALLGSLSNTHFDGVLDVHTGQEAPLWLFLAEGLINWLCMAVVLIIFAYVVSRSSFRVIDIFGTQALARWPYLIAAIALLPPGSQRYTQYLAWKFARIGSEVSCESTDVIFFVLATIIALLTLIWMVALMYRAYSVSCNIKGARAVGTFIAGIIAAEILSKVILWRLMV